MEKPVNDNNVSEGSIQEVDKETAQAKLLIEAAIQEVAKEVQRERLKDAIQRVFQEKVQDDVTHGNDSVLKCQAIGYIDDIEKTQGFRDLQKQAYQGNIDNPMEAQIAVTIIRSQKDRDNDLTDTLFEKSMFESAAIAENIVDENKKSSLEEHLTNLINTLTISDFPFDDKGELIYEDCDVIFDQGKVYRCNDGSRIDDGGEQSLDVPSVGTVETRTTAETMSDDGERDSQSHQVNAVLAINVKYKDIDNKEKEEELFFSNRTAAIEVRGQVFLEVLREAKKMSDVDPGLKNRTLFEIIEQSTLGKKQKSAARMGNIEACLATEYEKLISSSQTPLSPLPEKVKKEMLSQVNDVLKNNIKLDYGLKRVAEYSLKQKYPHLSDEDISKEVTEKVFPQVTQNNQPITLADFEKMLADNDVIKASSLVQSISSICFNKRISRIYDRESGYEALSAYDDFCQSTLLLTPEQKQDMMDSVHERNLPLVWELSQRHFQDPNQPLLSAQEISTLLNTFSEICEQYQPKDQTEAEILWKYSQYPLIQNLSADQIIPLMVELSQRHFQEPKQPLLSAQEISILLNNFSKICAQYQPKDQTEAEILWKYSQYTETQSRTADERIIDIDFIRTQLNIFKNIKDMKQFINGYSMNALVGFDATHSIFLETQERIEAAQKDYILSGDPHELHDAINLVYDWLETSVKSEQFKDYPLFLKGFLQLCRLLKETLGRVFGYETALGKNKASMMGSIAQLINQQPNYDLLQKFLAQESSGLGLKEQQTLLNNVFQQQLDEIKKKQPQKYSQFHHQALSSFQQGLISNASMLQTLDAGIPLYKLFSKEGGKKAQVLEQIKHDNIEQVAISTNGGVVLTFKEPLIYVGDTLNEIEVGSRDIFENSPEFAQKSFQIMVEQFQQGSSLSLADFLNQKSQEIRLASGLESILQSNDQITSARDQVMQLSPQGARAHIDRQLQNEPEDVVLSPEQVQRAKQVIKHLPPQAREALGDFASRFFDEQPQPTQKDLKSLSLFIEYQRENYRHDRRLFDLRKYLKVPEVARKIMEESALQQSVIRKYLQDSQRSEGEQELPTPASLKEFLGNACLESAEPEQYLLQKEVIAALKSNQALLSKPVDYYFEQIFQNEGLKTVIQGIKEESGTEDWLMSCAYEFYINTERDDTSRWERVKDEVFCKAHPDKEAFFELLQHTCIDDIVCDEKGQIKFEEVFAKVPEGSPIYRVLLTDGKHIEFDARSPRSGELRGNNLMRALQDALEQSKDSANHPTISEAITNSQQFQKSIHTAMFNTMSSMILGSKSNQKIFSALPDLTIKLPDVLEQEVGFDEIGIKEVLGKISDPDYYDEVLKLLVCRTLEFTERGFFEKQMQVMQCLLKYEKEHPEVALDDAQRKDTLEELMSCDGCVNFKKIIDKLHNTLSEGVPKIPSHEASRSGEDVRTNLGELKKVDLYQGSYPPGVNKGKDNKLRR